MKAMVPVVRDGVMKTLVSVWSVRRMVDGVTWILTAVEGASILLESPQEWGSVWREFSNRSVMTMNIRS